MISSAFLSTLPTFLKMSVIFVGRGKKMFADVLDNH